jgi:hypothetical protein
LPEETIDALVEAANQQGFATDKLYLSATISSYQDSLGIQKG